MSELGRVALFLALGVSIYSALAFSLGSGGKRPRLLASARNGAIAVFGLTSAAVAALAYALVSHDFRLELVTSYTSRDLSLPYLLSALWAGNEGSILFWGWLLSLFAAIVALRREHSLVLAPPAAAIAMAVVAFFLLMTASVANPFQKLPFPPQDGLGLNPLLENPAMLLHPPLLLAGYAGFTIPFAFALAALLRGRLNADWTETVRSWALLSWLLLGLGNLLGAWWAYVELGWGGYWAWDPVENAGLMPWLTATAFLHSSLAQRRRGILQGWSLVLIILTFNLIVFGAFITRSGSASSPHIFAGSSAGLFFLGLLAVSLLTSQGLLFYRWERLEDGGKIKALISREGAFLVSNLLLAGATAIIFLGTIVLGGAGTTSSFFNRAVGPLFLALLVLMGICALLDWRRPTTGGLLKSFRYPLLAGPLAGVGLSLSGTREWLPLLALSLCASATFMILSRWLTELRGRLQMRDENPLKAFFALIWSNRPRYGGYIVHLSLLIMAVGIIGSSFYKVEREATLALGETMSIKGYTLRYEGMVEESQGSKLVMTATLSLYNDGEFVDTLTPERHYPVSYRPVAETTIRSTLREDLYVVLEGWDSNDAAILRATVNPLVMWLWIGGGVLLLGGALALWPGLRRHSNSRDFDREPPA
ncbi:MAG: heme lyase CcmF/NrfE family subunit [Chloroflexi bacterium]|nr:heme lyase CcmF/NrfE family subunit [Chloroflexota bacterium]